MTKSKELAEPKTYYTTWTRGSDGSFNDIEKEQFATLLAKGKSIAEAARTVGINHRTGSGWAAHEDMKERKRVLRARPGVSQTFSVSIAMIVAELHRNALEARDAQQYKASNDALDKMYEIAKNEKSLLETFEAKGEPLPSNPTDFLAKMKKLQKRPELPSPVPDALDATPVEPVEGEGDES